jgi:AraC-like DNA-binding protein
VTPRQHKSTHTLTRYNSTFMAPINDAIEAIKSLKPGEELSCTKIAEQFGVDRSTLSRKHKAIQTSHATKIINQQKLNSQQERELVQYIEEITARHLPPTREMIRNFASTIAKEPVSESWVTRFINRHSIHLISQWATSMDANRHQADRLAPGCSLAYVW